MLYSLVPSSLPLGKNEDMTITNKRRIKKIIYIGNNINVCELYRIFEHS